MKKQKAKSLKKLKKSLSSTNSIDDVIQIAQNAIKDYIQNHNQTFQDIASLFQDLTLPTDIKNKEAGIRKALNQFYKKRSDSKFKAMAIYISFEHAKLLLLNPENEWKNFIGLQKLQSNLKAEEYFEALLILMCAFQDTFSESEKHKKLSKDIERMFELWNSRNIAKKQYEEKLNTFPNAKTSSDKHFAILSIVEYLHRRYKYNPKYRDQLVKWCEKDVSLYETFLIESNEHALFSIDQQISFTNNSDLRKKKLSGISIEKVKRLKNYFVPRLPSYDILEEIYQYENNLEKICWLHSINKKIGYKNNTTNESPKENQINYDELDFSKITKTIEASKSDVKGKLGFLNSQGEACSTEDYFKEYAENNGWKVMRAEVSFWQAMFCLSFWEEIFNGMEELTQLNDIPDDLFQDEMFYLNRQNKIDNKFQLIAQQDLKTFIKKQIKKTKGMRTRLLLNGNKDLVPYLETETVQLFLNRIEPILFSKIVYRIARNPNENRSGLSDFIIWNDTELKMIEVKKIREQVRDSQKNWLIWMMQEGVPSEIVRVKGI